VQRGPPPNARRLGIGVRLREDDVLDGSRIDSAALDHRLDNPRSEILGAQHKLAIGYGSGGQRCAVD